MKSRWHIYACIALIVAAISVVSPARAHAHGIGGIESTETNAKVTSVRPESSDFVIETIENGKRIRITQKSSTTLYVLGIEGEQYIRITTKGTYLNEKSSTYLVNDAKKESTGSSLTLTKWKKISSSRSYAWVEHRAHYMGSVPEGLEDLGSNRFIVKVGNTEHLVTVAFRAAHGPSPVIPFTVLGIFFLIVALGAWKYRKRFVSLFSQNVVRIILVLIAVLELSHIAGYLRFAQESTLEEITSLLYALILVALTFSCLYKIMRAREQPWEKTLHTQAPLFCVTGFVGIAVGTLIEYQTLLDPFPATSLSPTIARIGIISIGCLSSIIFALGMLHIKDRDDTPLHPSA